MNYRYRLNLCFYWSVGLGYGLKAAVVLPVLAREPRVNKGELHADRPRRLQAFALWLSQAVR